MSRTLAVKPENFSNFGELLRYLRRKAGLTQRELAIAVGYSESQISRLEQNERAPDEATLAARFIPALYLEEQVEWASRFLDLGSSTHSNLSQAESKSTASPFISNNLPIQLTNFFGREKELKEIKRLLTTNLPEEESVRLLTLSGHGGCGKTRLALQAAFSMQDTFPDGIWLVEFGPVTDPDLIMNTLASVLGVAEEPDEDLLSAIIEHLRNKNTLLIFDNCEHVIQVSAELAESILHACPKVYILATSRELLGVGGERAMKVPSLSMPDRRHPPALGEMAKFESVQLFVDRAANVIPGFNLNPGNESSIAQICSRLDGIPLAIELAAARLRMLPVEQIASRLDDVFRLLTGGNRTALPRHQTLQALIDWSYDLLTEPEKTLFQRLAVFARSWTLEACESICAGDHVNSGDVLELLGHLIDKSLALKRTKVEGRELRYRLLDTIRQYALTKLIESGEVDTIRRKHAEYYFSLAEAGAPRALSDYTQKKWLESIEIEIDNIRAALTWSLSNVNSDALSLRMDRKDGIRVSAWALNRLGGSARERGNTTTARTWLEQSLSIYRQLDDKLGLAWTTVTLGEVLNIQGDLQSAKPMLEEGLSLARSHNEGEAVGWASSSLGFNALLRGELNEAHKFYSECKDVFDSLGPHKAGLAWAYFGLGEAALAKKTSKVAMENLKTAMNYFNSYKNRSGVAWCIEILACAASLNSLPQEAVHLWNLAEALHDSKEVRKAPIIEELHEKMKAEVLSVVGEDTLKEETADKQSYSLEQAVNEAMAI